MMNEDAELQQEVPRSKKRSRKKQLYSNLKELMEFYFSAANLSKERWLTQRLDENGSIELSHFLSFNKIRALTNDVNDIIKAIKNSEILEVIDDSKVRRTKPVEYKENPDDCIIYIERIPPDADHDWLKNFFSCYGSIDYISIPKYPTSKKCKGFAFIEFSNPESAQKAVEEYKKAGQYLSNNIEPQELLSVATFEKTNKQQTNATVEIDTEEQVQNEEKISSNNKRKNDEIECENNLETDQLESSKKIKLASEEEKSDNVDMNTTDATNAEEELQSEEYSEGLEGNTDEARKRKNRKKKKKTKKNKVTPEATGFQVLSKKDWKSLRNKYLSIQRDKMKQLKKHLQQNKMNTNGDNVSEKKKKHKKSTNDEELNVENKLPISKDFIPGVIVKISVSEPIVNLKEFKAELKSKCENIKYIDVKEGSFMAFVRLSNPEIASEFCEKSIGDSMEILKGAEELNYWDKVEKERQLKLSKPAAKVKQRGREKILKKAEKVLGKHITFGDEAET
ncbi:hypothetical protein O3M35_007517 [Rhynocoris fuscipes]|uniref:Uncharacterized protein n=1 Tax=Rhynocoris fuscipes TaxID=488301 RepID=A0AAW1DGW6_9HEMI